MPAATATAVVSEPPLPSVVISASAVAPWNPATMAMRPAASASRTRSARTSAMRALVCPDSVTMPACAPVNEIASWPSEWIAMASSAMVTCSPVASSMSISRSGGSELMAPASSSRSSVTSPIAETTATTELPASLVAMIRRATARMRSVVATERILAVARRIIATKEAGNSVVAVVSAMGDVTDDLLELAGAISSDPPEREMDMLLATGEQVTIALLAMAIHSLGHEAISFTGAQAGIVTESGHTKARIAEVRADRVRDALAAGRIAIVAGFQGATADAEITTLGRGGSDTTAVAVAAGIGADVCEIYTDVDGVYTADPRIVPGARKLDAVSYEVVLEMAASGARVLQLRSVEYARNHGVTLHVRSSFNDRPGTIVKEADETMEQAIISGVTHDTSEAKITIRDVPDRPGVAAEVFSHLADANVNVDMIIQNVSEDGLTDISFTTPGPG